MRLHKISTFDFLLQLTGGWFSLKRSDPRRMAMPVMAMVNKSRLVEKSCGGGGGGLLAACSLSASRVALHKTSSMSVRTGADPHVWFVGFHGIGVQFHSNPTFGCK